MSNDIIIQVCDGLDMLNEDNSIPRNIRRGAEEIKTILLKLRFPVILSNLNVGLSNLI